MASSETYQNLKLEIGAPEQIKSNILVWSIPGMGAGHLAKQYVEEHPQVKYINGPDQELGEGLTVMYLAYDIDKEALGWADNYIRGTNLNQKFIIFLNAPYLLETEKYKKSYLAGHIYKTVWLKTLESKEIKEVAQEYNQNLNPNDLDLIVELSGGLPQLAKYLAINSDDLSSKTEDSGLIKVMEPTLSVISQCNPKVLEKMGLTIEGQLRGRLLQAWMKKLGGIKEKIDITISFDLGVIEDDEKTGMMITLQEKQILEEMMVGGNQITKEKVSDIKWGEGKYDQFSDQAINKTMRRLDAKLKWYQIETIPKVGYRISKRISG